jgi:membrane protein DedA with SNARE-associated domain
VDAILPYFQSSLEGYQVLWISLLLIVASKYLFPVPEDLTLLFTGFLAATRYATLSSWIFWWACVVAVVVADGSLFFLARVFLSVRSIRGKRLHERLLREQSVFGARFRTALQTAETFFDRYGTWALFLARFIPYTRSAVFLFAGASSMSLTRYLPYEVAGAFCSVSLTFGLGYFFATELASIVQTFFRYQSGLSVAGGVVLALILARFWLRSRQRAI